MSESRNTVRWDVEEEVGRMYKPGDRVVYVAAKHSSRPSPRAKGVQPEAHGEGYSYNVKKYWRVLDVKNNGMLAVVTRRGKQRLVPDNDPRLRPANWWERMFQNSRFPQPGDEQRPADSSGIAHSDQSPRATAS